MQGQRPQPRREDAGLLLGQQREPDDLLLVAQEARRRDPSRPLPLEEDAVNPAGHPRTERKPTAHVRFSQGSMEKFLRSLTSALLFDRFANRIGAAEGEHRSSGGGHEHPFNALRPEHGYIQFAVIHNRRLTSNANSKQGCMQISAGCPLVARSSPGLHRGGPLASTGSNACGR